MTEDKQLLLGAVSFRLAGMSQKQLCICVPEVLLMVGRAAPGDTQSETVAV